MQEFIVSETNKIFNKAIQKFAKQERLEDNQVSILLSLSKDKEKSVEYTICHDFQPNKKVKIMDILGVKIDLRGYSILVPPQIKKILEGFETEQNSSEVEVGVYINPEEDDEIVYYLFKEGNMVRKFELADVLKIE